MSELYSDFSDAWERFQASTSLRLLVQTLESEWTRGRTDYFAFLISVTDDAAREYAARTLEALSGIPGVDPYPERYWHITIKGVGFLAEQAESEDEVTMADIERIAEAARPALESQPAFDVGVGPVNAFDEVVFLEAHDGGATRALNSLLLAEVPGLQRYPVDGDTFLPHVSIARFSSDEGLPQLKETLARLRAEGGRGPRFTAAEALLIRAHLAREAPTFDLVAEYPLRG